MKIKLLGFFIIGLFLVNSVYAVNYVLTYNSVDAGEIRWGGTTKYSTQWNAAILMWNNYGRIDILPDTVTTYEDLTVSDVNLSNVGRSGVYSNVIGSDTIKLNKYYLDGISTIGNFSSAEKQHTIGHELGHSLGLDHHNLFGNVLRSGKRNYTTLGTQDKLDYNYLWGN